MIYTMPDLILYLHKESVHGLEIVRRGCHLLSDPYTNMIRMYNIVLVLDVGMHSTQMPCK